MQRDQSGTYGCRVLDYDAAEEAELSQALELRVACESPGRTWRGVWHWQPLPLHPPPVLPPNVQSLFGSQMPPSPWGPCPSPL